MGNTELKALLTKGLDLDTEEVALLFSGGVDSSIVLNLLLENQIRPDLYCCVLEDNTSSDLRAYRNVCNHFGFKENLIVIPRKTEIRDQYKVLIEKYNAPTNRPSILLIMSLFIFCLENIPHKLIYTGLGSDSYYGIGREFRIGCSKKGERAPSLESMQAFRRKTYDSYNIQVELLKRIEVDYGKEVIIPFMNQAMLDYFWGKTFEDCNKPKQKQILLNLYPEYFRVIRPRLQTNFQCGDSNFKLLTKRKG